ncbi:MAG: flagellar hook capping FlgD N-terminal domain-containing protein [Parvularculaceae bacterium]
MDAVSTAAVANNSYAAAPAAVRAESPASVDFESFLRLLTAQLRYQDPLSPLESTEFVAQLASFSTVEQLVKANERLDAIAGGSNALEIYADWIGREAGVAGPPVRFDGAPVELKIDPRADADRVEVVISDASGAEVARFAAANAAGSQFWDGSTASGAAAPGVYSIRAHYFADGNLLAQASPTVFDRIVEVSVENGAAQLRLSSGAVVSPDEVATLRAGS